MAYDNAGILNCYKLRAFILLSMSGRLRKCCKTVSTTVLNLNFKYSQERNEVKTV